MTHFLFYFWKGGSAYGEKRAIGERVSGSVDRETQKTLSGLHGVQDGPDTGHPRSPDSVRSQVGLPRVQEIRESQETAEPRILCGVDGQHVLFSFHLPREQGGSIA